MRKLYTLIVSALLGAFSVQAQTENHYVGGDISLLPEYESAGAIYKDHTGKTIAQVLPWLREQGMNAMRVRLFVNPSDYKGADKDPNACQDLEYIKPLCKRIVDNGFDLLLDFHYSDTWADPVKQYTPAAWKDLTDEQLIDKIYEYTRTCLLELKAEGVVPAFIQPGNEISYGMLWGPEGTSDADKKKCLMGSDANWERLANLLKSAIKACHEVCPDAAIILHNERVAKTDILNNFFAMMKKYNVDYDIIGLSYYPYFHGKISVLSNALNGLTLKFPEKKIMIVETGYSYKWEVPGTTEQTTDVWPLTEAGQNAFAKDLVSTLERYPKCIGLFWWWMEYNAYGTGLSGWYNAPLFDSNNGRATPALTTICSFAKDESGVDTVLHDSNTSSLIFNMQGLPVENISVPGLYILNGKKIMVK
ncbi:MAG: arabinogalactan endo-1,4-beta-galactosidase [Muribaculum sp.]|nr:arabinogalactan endo-1,4-beta-galactosidase [Muribaculum sp.]